MWDSLVYPIPEALHGQPRDGERDRGPMYINQEGLGKDDGRNNNPASGIFSNAA